MARQRNQHVHHKGIVPIKDGQVLRKDRKLAEQHDDKDDRFRHCGGQAQVVNRPPRQLGIPQHLHHVDDEAKDRADRREHGAVHRHPAEDRGHRLQAEAVQKRRNAQHGDQYGNDQVHPLLQRIALVKGFQDVFVQSRIRVLLHGCQTNSFTNELIPRRQAGKSTLHCRRIAAIRIVRAQATDGIDVDDGPLPRLLHIGKTA